MEDINAKKRGVKLTIISDMDFEDWKEIGESIKALGYKLTIVDNGNMVCTK